MQDPEHTHHQRHKRQSPEDSDKKSSFRKMESMVSKYILQIIAIIFILASIWYAANSAEKIVGIIKNLISSERIIQPKISTPGQSVIPLAEPATQFQFSVPMIVWILVITVIIIVSFLLARHFRRKEIGRIAVLAFYPMLLFLARKYGWQIHLLFPLVLLFSILLFRNGIRLRSAIAFKINVLLVWLFYGIWWFPKVGLGGQNELFFLSLLYSGFFFCWFLWAGIHRGFSGYHQSYKFTEFIAVFGNIGAFYLFASLTFYKFGFSGRTWLFTLLLSLFLFMTMYLSDKFERKFNKNPYLLGGIVLMSLVLPLLFRMEVFLVFFGCLSILLILYGRYAGISSPIIGSLVSLLIMMLLFLENWILHYIPAAFFQNIFSDKALVNSGILAGLIAIPVLLVDRVLLKKAEVTFSKKWFNRKTYLRLMKGTILLTIYLTGFWIFNYFVMFIIGVDEAKFLSWFCFTCLYFIVVLPILSKQESSYFRPFIWFSLFILVIYPGLIHFSVVDMRNESLKLTGYSWAGFIFHYFATALLIINLWLTGIFFTRIYKENRSYLNGFRIFLVPMLIFLIISEMDHMTIISGLKNGIGMKDIIMRNIRLPYTVIMTFFSIVILGLGFFRRSHFLRAMGLVMFVLILIKFICLDASVMSSTGRIILLFSVGMLALTLSIFYPKIRIYFQNRDHYHRHHQHHRRENDERNTNNP